MADRRSNIDLQSENGRVLSQNRMRAAGTNPVNV